MKTSNDNRYPSNKQKSKRKNGNFRSQNDRTSCRTNDDRDSRSASRNDRNRNSATSAANDISWYSKNPNLLLAAGSIPYPYRPGMQLELYNDGVSPLFQQIPGAMGIEWMPSVGYSTKNTDPISVAAKEIYGKVRRSFSGNLEADAPDYIMYLMALDSVFAYIAWLKRVFRTINAYSSENFFSPDGLLQTYGFDVGAVQELRLNKMQLWQAINTLVLQTRKFRCPALMDVINRHYWLSDNVYTDSATPKAQFYVFNPRAFYILATDVPEPVTPENTVDGLRYILNPCYGNNDQNGSWLQSGTVVQNLYEFGEKLISALVAWDVGYTISGYLDRAYEGVPSFVVDEIDYAAVLEPVYSAEVLTQIENSAAFKYLMPSAFGTPSSPTEIGEYFPVSQLVSENAIYSQPYAGFSNAASALYRHIKAHVNVHSDTPTVADTVIATRLHPAIDDRIPVTGGWATSNYAFVPGTELVYQFRLVMPTNEGADGNPYSILEFSSANVVYENDPSSSYRTLLNVLTALSHFDWHPFWDLLVVENSTTLLPVSAATVGDIQNITLITQQDLANLNTVCLYSEFNAFNF